MIKSPLVGVVLVNFNGHNDTMECLKSLKKLTYLAVKIYVVDNGSKETPEALFRKAKGLFDEQNLELMSLKDNLGFAGGNNIGIRKAISDGAQYIWLLNNDTVVDEESLGHLVLMLENNERCGIVGSKIYFYGTNKIWFAGGTINRFGIPHHRRYCEVDYQSSLDEEKVPIDYITGCSLLARSEMINEIGLLDEDFFLYYEDTEYCRRAVRLGWGLEYQPKSLIWHKVNASTKSKLRDPIPLLDYYDIRNSILFVRRSYHTTQKILPFIGIVIKIIKKHIRLMIRPETRKINKIKMIYHAIYDAIHSRYGVYRT
ncbi:glycosyltransferase family 2 protein [Cohnella sp. AR92]|uniref:glycosyltransferase family 2 protein n=1 Tax=Cohnella sp. AR92 TaxID=648716 RepID=UPI000F8D74A5|nr:glycosyltransferase family 2 protein [Cohnella sp. AR92]RUS45284.1 glycosyltransferase family 2 protein [Cohnella sp. AR92]